MRRSRLHWYDIAWPGEIEVEAVTGLLRHLAVTSAPRALCFEVRTEGGRTRHRLGLPEPRAARLIETMQSLVSGVLFDDVAKPEPDAHGRAIEVRLSSRERALRVDDPTEVSRSILTALAAAPLPIAVRWYVGRRLGPQHVGNNASEQLSSPAWLRAALVGRERDLDARGRTELRAKVGQHGFRTACVISTSISERALAVHGLRRVAQALRVAEGPGVHLRFRTRSTRFLTRNVAPWRLPMALNVAELVGLLAWPLGSEPFPGVRRMPSRRLPVPVAVPEVGRVLGDGSHPQTRRPIALSARDALLHLHCLGPTGEGKSTLLAHVSLRAIAAGDGVVVVEPKGDLVNDVLSRIPREREGDVVVLDPGDVSQPVGLNPLAGGEPELVTDRVLAVFRGLYGDYLGPRTTDVLVASVQTLARSEHASLCLLPALLTDARYRRQLVADVRGDIGLSSFWAWFESLSDAERPQVVAPTMNKLRPLLLRERVRLVVGQVRPRFDIGDVFRRRQVLLVPLNKGLLGGEAAGLIGSFVLAQLWASAQGRSRIAPARRRPVTVIVDEFQDFLHLPTDLTDALAQARGLGLSFVVAHQHLAQLTPAVRASVLANARSRVCFRLSADDAGVIARTTQLLDASDFQSLDRYEVYASLVADGATQAYCSAVTRPLPAAGDAAERIRRLSRERYGRPKAEVEAELRTLLGGDEHERSAGAIGRQRRRRA